MHDLKHLTVKSYLYTLNTYPEGPNVTPFHHTVVHFSDIFFCFPIGCNGEFQKFVKN